MCNEIYLVEDGPHHVLTAGVAGEVEGRQVALVAEVVNQSVLRLGGEGGLGVGGDVFEQLSGDLLLAVVSRDVEGSHADLGARLPQTDSRLREGRQI